MEIVQVWVKKVISIKLLIKIIAIDHFMKDKLGIIVSRLDFPLLFRL